MPSAQAQPDCSPRPLLAGVELGGTKAVALLACGSDIVDQMTLQTGAPAPTLAALVDWLEQASGRHGPFAALGVASFGPLCLDKGDPRFGCLTTTPKPGWSGIDVLQGFRQRFGVPIAIDTDVNGAALAEGCWGAAQQARVHAYLTIGTGIGLGVVVDGRTVHGAMHPEFGHIRIRRRSGDAFPGICPWHGDCLEGLVSGPAIAARSGVNAGKLDASHPIWADVVADLAEAMAILILTLSPQRIVIGGGVAMGQPQIIDRMPAAIASCLGGYLPDAEAIVRTGLVTRPQLGHQAGPLGAIMVARTALVAGE